MPGNNSNHSGMKLGNVLSPLQEVENLESGDSVRVHSIVNYIFETWLIASMQRHFQNSVHSLAARLLFPRQCQSQAD